MVSILVSNAGHTPASAIAPLGIPYMCASELSESNEAVRKQIGQFDLGPQGVTSAALKSSTAQTPAKAPAKATKSAKAQQPKPNGAAMNGAAKSGLDLDERGFGRY